MDSFANIVPPSVLLSPQARIAYKSAAIGTKLLLFFILAFGVFDVSIPASFALIARLAIFYGALSAGALTVGMEYYWFKFDTSGGWKKTFWFLAQLLVPIGTLLYFYAVYLPQTKRVEVRALSASNAN